MKCSNCGYENVEGANFCANCNNALAAEAVPVAEDTPVAEDALVTEDAYVTEATPAAEDVPAADATQSAASSSAYYYGTAAQSNAYNYNYAAAQAAPYNSASARTAASYNYQPYYYANYPRKTKQPFTITDAYIIIGFVLAVVGIFTYAFILLPASIFFSVVGFVKRTNARTLGLSIAGIVVGVVACLIKVGMVLNELGVIPEWLSAGIF